MYMCVYIYIIISQEIFGCMFRRIANMAIKDEYRVYIPSVDIIMFITSFVFSTVGTPNSNLNLQRICYILLDNEKSKCELLGVENNNETNILEEQVQYKFNQIQLVHQCTESIFTMFMSLLIGPWTDKYGRRPGIILTTTGMLISSLYSTFNAAVEISPWYGLVGGIPGMFTGGAFGFMIIASSYLMDITNLKNRGFRVAVFQAITSAGGIGGTFLSTPLLNLTSYLKLNIMASAAVFVIWLFAVFGIQESLENVETKGRFRGLFDMSNPKRMFQTTFKKREGANRGIVLLITAVCAVGTFIGSGDGQLMTLFLRRKFGWVMAQYTVYNGIGNIVSIAGTVLGTLLFTKLFKLRESVSCLIVYCFTMAASLLTGFAVKDWHIYLVLVLRALDGTHHPFITTLLSRLVTQREIGKVLSGMSGVQFFCSLFSSPLYTAIYQATMSTNPGLYNFLSSALFSIIFILLILIIYLEKKYRLPNTDDETTNLEKDIQKDSFKKTVNEVAAEIG